MRFAICLAAKPDDDLQEGKVYRVLPDARAEEVGCLRIIDDSGEDYLYAAIRFVLLDVPPKERGRLLKAVAGEQGLFRPRTRSAEDGALGIRAARKPRQGWDAAFREMARRGDDAPIDDAPPGLSSWDEDEWEWQ